MHLIAIEGYGRVERWSAVPWWAPRPWEQPSRNWHWELIILFVIRILPERASHSPVINGAIQKIVWAWWMWYGRVLPMRGKSSLMVEFGVRIAGVHYESLILYWWWYWSLSYLNQSLLTPENVAASFMFFSPCFLWIHFLASSWWSRERVLQFPKIGRILPSILN